MNERVLIVLIIVNIALAIWHAIWLRQTDKLIAEAEELRSNARILLRQTQLVCADLIDEQTRPLPVGFLPGGKLQNCNFGRN